MNWNRLKNYKCPKCNSVLKDIGHYHACTKKGCIFSINKAKFDEVVSSRQKAYKPAFEDNQEALNNMGHDLISEDFSDSPHLL